MCPLSGVERFPLLGGFQCQWESDRDQSINRGYTVHVWFFMLNDIDWQCVRCSIQLYYYAQVNWQLGAKKKRAAQNLL